MAVKGDKSKKIHIVLIINDVPYGNKRNQFSQAGLENDLGSTRRGITYPGRLGKLNNTQRCTGNTTYPERLIE